MPRRYILTACERAGLVAIPTDETELIRLYTLSEQDLSVIKQRRGDANRLGFAVLLCCLRYPGYALPAGEDPPHTFLTMISAQLGVEPEIWAEYAGREETRREHLSELRILSIAESDFSNTLLVFEKLVRLCFLQPRLAKEELFPC
jgi:TnpA family transposase